MTARYLLWLKAGNTWNYLVTFWVVVCLDIVWECVYTCLQWGCHDVFNLINTLELAIVWKLTFFFSFGFSCQLLRTPSNTILLLCFQMKFLHRKICSLWRFLISRSPSCGPHRRAKCLAIEWKWSRSIALASMARDYLSPGALLLKSLICSQEQPISLRSLLWARAGRANLWLDSKPPVSVFPLCFFPTVQSAYFSVA